MAHEWEMNCMSTGDGSKSMPHPNQSSILINKEPTNGYSCGSSQLRIESNAGHHLSASGLSESNPTAFPFPPPPFYLRNIVQTHPQRSPPPWISHHSALPYSNPSDVKLVTSTNSQTKSLPEDTSPLKTDSTNFPNSKHLSVQSKTQMNGGERHQNAANINVCASVTSRVPQENSLNWLADVAVQSRNLRQTMSPENKKESPSGCSSEDSTSSFTQRNDTHFRASDVSTGPVPYPTHPSIPFQLPQNAFMNQFPSYFTAYCQTQYYPSGHPSSPFLVPTPPASAPPTVRSAYFQDALMHQALMNASINSSSSMPMPQNLSIRSPSRHSPISPSSLSSPLSGRNASPPNITPVSQNQLQAKLDDNKEDLAGVSQTHKSSDVTKTPNDLNRGIEGSRKHRILRIPSIQLNQAATAIVEPAPMSAPPAPGPLRQKIPRKHHYAPAVSDSISKDGLRYPECFYKGSCISLADGTVKHVEDMSTKDFLECARMTPHLKIDTSVVVGFVEKKENCSVAITFAVGKRGQKLTVEAPLEHPFYVYEQGWASCSPEKTFQRYGLVCKKLQKDNICVSLTRDNREKAKSLLAKEPTSFQSAISESRHEENLRKKAEGDGSCSIDLERISVSPSRKKRRYSAPEAIAVDEKTRVET